MYLAGKREKNKDDAIVFGDPILSFYLKNPLLFDQILAQKLSLDIKFIPGRSDTQIIGSATRNWRELTEMDVSVILSAIVANEIRGRSSLLSSEEVSETIEKDVEEYLVSHPERIGENLRFLERQLPVESGRIDILFEDEMKDLVVVEVKLGKIGRDALHQIKRYVNDIRKMEHERKVNGVLVCSGVMPAFEEDFRKEKSIRILKYGWEMKVTNW